jgi:hypothetical protein
VVELVHAPVANVMMVRMAEALRDARPADAARAWRAACRALALVFFPLIAVLLACAPDLIVFLFTERYRASVPIFMVWSLTLALPVLPTDGALRVYAATPFLLAVSAARLVLLAAVLGTALTRWGLLGAVAATLAVAAAAKVAALARTVRSMGTGLARALPWQQLAGIAVVAAAAAVPAIFAGRALEGPPALRLAVPGAAYAAAYGALVVHAGLLEPDEKRALAARLPRLAPFAAARG